MATTTRITIRDIAERAGVHFTTVSLALRNSPRLKAETRRQIQELAQTMGYRPDPMLAALNAYRQSRQPVHFQASIAWIHNWKNPDNLYNCREFYLYREGARERAQERGYSVEEMWMHEPGMSVTKLHRVLRARNIQGALIAPQPEHGMYLDLRYEELSAVAFGYSMQPAVLDLVTNHHGHTIKLLLEHVLELGYRRIGLCLPEGWNDKVEKSWQSGMLQFRAEHPELPHVPDHLWDERLGEDSGDWRLKRDKHSVVEWIRSQKPEVVLSFNEVYEDICAAGIRAPEDVGFASLFLNEGEKVLSGVHQNDRLIGQKAVDMVIDMLHRGETGIPETPVRMLVEGVLHPGSTLRARRAAVRQPRRRKPSRRMKAAA